MTPAVTLKLGEWLPDLPDLDNPGATIANNCLPLETVYKQYQPLLGTSDAASARIQGAYAATDNDGNTIIYAGSAAKLESLAGTTWTDRSKVGGYTTASAGYWKFSQFGSLLIATNFSDAPQSITVAGAVFADLADSPPKARHIGIVGNFVMLGDLDESGTLYPYKVRWSAIDNAEDWPTPNTQEASEKQAGEENLNADYGKVMHIANGEQIGLVFQERGITRFIYTGGDTVFQVETYERARGLYAPNGAAQVGGTVYYLARDGFYATDGAQVVPIGFNKVDRTFLADLNATYPERVTAAVDPQNKLIFWSYPSNSSSDGTPDSMIVYNYQEGRWASADDSIGMIFSGKSQGFTLEQLDAVDDLDSLPASLDSPIWTGGQPIVAGFTTDFKYGTFIGTVLAAQIDTQEGNINPGGLATVQGVQPLVTGSGITTVKVGTRTLQSASTSYGSALSVNSRNGMADTLSTAFYHRVRLEISGGFTQAIGARVYATPAGFA